MKKQEFKNLIKESVKEVLLEGGILSTIIAEVVKGLGTSVVVEQKSSQKPPTLKAAESKLIEQERENQRQKLVDTKRKMLEAIGKSSYGGVDILRAPKPFAAEHQVVATLFCRMWIHPTPGVIFRL